MRFGDRWRGGLFAVGAVTVVLASGGGTYAVVKSVSQHSTAQPPATQTSGSLSQPATAAGSPPLRLVAVAPGIPASSTSDSVRTLLSHYFHGINSRSYAEYASTLTPAEQTRQSRSAFRSGYATTTDSGMTLISLTGSASGLTATVTFTSHQDAGQSLDHSPCNDWTLSFSLVARGSGYLIGPAPAGYRPGHSDC
jgi:hypothetical protein